MSWLSDLTGKAGAFLEKMDQAAATSLQEAGIGSPSHNSGGEPGSGSGSRQMLLVGHDPRKLSPSGTGIPYEPTAYQSLSSPSERGAAVAQVLVGSASGSAHLTSTPKVPVSAAATAAGASKFDHKPAVTDDSIFEFLNAPSPGSINNGRKNAKLKVVEQFPSPSLSPSPSPATIPVQAPGTNKVPRPISSPGAAPEELEADKKKMRVSSSMPDMRRDSGKDDRKSVEGVEETEGVDGNSDKAQGSLALDEDHMPPIVMISASSADDQAAVPTDGEGVVKDTPTGESGAEREIEEWKRKVSNLQLENKLMKREVSALNEELGTVTSRASEASNSRAHYESEIDALREQASRSDHLIRQLRSHEEDLQASLEARDSQIVVLRTQLSVSDKALEDAKERLLLSKKEQER